MGLSEIAVDVDLTIQTETLDADEIPDIVHIMPTVLGQLKAMMLQNEVYEFKEATQHFEYKGNVFASDGDSLTYLVARYSRARWALANGKTWDTQMLSNGGSLMKMSAEEFIAFGDAMNDHVEAEYTVMIQRQAQIMAAETLDEVYAIAEAG